MQEKKINLQQLICMHIVQHYCKIRKKCAIWESRLESTFFQIIFQYSGDSDRVDLRIEEKHFKKCNRATTHTHLFYIAHFFHF